MNNTARSVFLATVCAASGCSHIERVSPKDTGRVSLEDLKKARPEFSDVDFSAIGKLLHDGELTCSAVLLKPGTIIATAQHCVEPGTPDLAYSFVTRDAAGRTHTIPLPAHGTRYFQYLHIPTLAYFDPSIKPTDTDKFSFQRSVKNLPADIAFFQLTTPVPKGIKPAEIAPAQTQDLEAVFAAGYSSHVRRPQGIEDSGLSIMKDPCHQAFNQGSKQTYMSTCFVVFGDSGGVHFVLKKGQIQVTAIHHSGVRGENSDMKSLLERQGVAGEVNRTTYSTPLAQMRGFCLESMGPKYCTGFPAPVPPQTR